MTRVVTLCKILSLCLVAMPIGLSAIPTKAPKIQVRLAKNLKKVVISGRDLSKRLRDASEKHYEGEKVLQFNCNGDKQSLKAPTQLLASIESKTGFIKWDQDKYRGEMLLASNPSHNSCDLINNIPLENYISTLLAKEMRGDWPVEALKAQAIAARSYAMFKMNKQDRTGLLYDLENSEKDQVNGSFNDETRKTITATQSTKGYVLISPKGKLTPTFYHSKCGGKTNLPQHVWGNSVDGYKRVRCPYCNSHGTKEWSYSMSEKDYISKLVGKNLDWKSIKRFKAVPDGSNRSQLRYYLNDKLHVTNKSIFRKRLGRRKIFSNNFKVSKIGEMYHFIGTGRGHGVGLCQFGAYDMALKGYDYEKILNHYFPNHKLVKLY